MVRPFLLKIVFPVIVTGLACLLLTGCQQAVASTAMTTASATPTKISVNTPTSTSSPASTPRPLTSVELGKPPASPTPVPTATISPTPPPTLTSTPTRTPEPTPTATPIGPCDQRNPGDDLFTLVTLEYGLSRDYVPGDLVSISEFFPKEITLGYPTEIRQIALDPLREMIDEMLSQGLQPMIISGYRSYATQALAWNKWRQQEPDRAQILSAPPGFSEHQLGTTIDFGSPELPDIVGQEEIQFHTYFYMTSESAWLAENAHRYGFTLSYPREAFELTGFYYEPWHYRYVGVDLATQLKEQGLFLAQHQFDTQLIPCIP